MVLSKSLAPGLCLFLFFYHCCPTASGTILDVTVLMKYKDDEEVMANIADFTDETIHGRPRHNQ